MLARARFILLFFAVFVALPASAQVKWRLRDPRPNFRSGTALASDTARGSVVLFGGNGGPGGFLADTWEWNGATWQSRAPSVSPTARDQHAMAYDAARQRVVLFGGRSGSTSILGDTWEWDGSN